MVPILPEDNLLLTLPFGGAVLKALGAPPEEVNAILEAKRKEVMSGKSLEETEEDLALAQLGIEPDEYRKRNSALATDIVDTTVVREDDGDAKVKPPTPPRRGVTKEKSPMVAQVIGEICPPEKSSDVAAEVVVEVNGDDNGRSTMAPSSDADERKD
jgi:hypothetical protein